MSISWRAPRKAYPEGGYLAVIGLLLIFNAEHWHGAVMLCVLPGSAVLLAAGVGLLLWPGDNRLPQYGVFGSILALFAMPWLALSGEALSALFFSVALIGTYVCAGRVSLQTFPQVAGAPTVPQHLKAAALLAADELIMAWFKLLARPPRGEAVQQIVDEVTEWEAWLSRKKLRSKLHKLHVTPPDLLKVESRERSVLGETFRHISFASGYQPEADMPGAARWLEREPNRTAHAWVFEHSGAARPWLLCIHGYRMGSPAIDLRVFKPEYFHRKLGMNMACLVLPLHGPRKQGLVSGQGYLEGNVLDFIHAELQAQWDLRRLLSWLRLVKHAPKIGVYGVSLGGYNTALLTGLDADLDCAVAGIPVTDMAATQWRHFPAPELTEIGQYGISEERIRQAYTGVSPLSFKAHLPPEKLAIFAGAIDSLVWPDQPLALQQHWDGAALHWYEGAHVTFANQPSVRDALLQTFAAGGLIDGATHGV